MKRFYADKDCISNLLEWMHSILNVDNIQLDQLGTGVYYCLILHHYFPHVHITKRINLMPKNRVDYVYNMRVFHDTLLMLKIVHISFDMFKITNLSYQDNIQLLTKLNAALTKIAPRLAKNVSEKSTNKSISLSQIPLQKKSSFQMNSTLSGFDSSKSTPKSSKAITNEIFFSMQSSIATPMKLPPQMTNHSSLVIEGIKSIINVKGKTDRQKVKELKLLLDIEIQQKLSFQQQMQKNLLSNDNNQKNRIIID